jgi:glutathione S-transferase
VSDGPIYHLALAAEWHETCSEYRGSTLGKSLDEVGFVHASTAAQVKQIADLAYRGRTDVLLLTIDPARLDAPVCYEAVEGGERFPHIYGPVPRAAVLAVRPLRCGANGSLEVGSLD